MATTEEMNVENEKSNHVFVYLIGIITGLFIALLAALALTIFAHI